MDERRFDDLTRAFGRATSRRSVLKGIVGGAVAALLGGGTAASVAAAPSRTVCDQQSLNACLKDADDSFQLCTQSCNTLACGNRAASPGETNLCPGCHAVCLANRQLQQHTCQTHGGCTSEQSCCNSGCSDTATDANNCGACGNACPSGQACVNGSCGCPSGQTSCDGTCIDTSADSNHCGSCTTVCGTCQTCVGGTCVDVACGAGQVCCQDQCVDACSSGAMDPTTCTCQCSSGQKLCGGTCTDILSSDFNCGDCDVMCSGGQTCQNGSCACPSQSPNNCSGSCVNFANDPYNCGSCGNQCGSNQVCTNGTCQNCPSGQTFCGGQCVSTTCQKYEQFNSYSCQCEQVCPVDQTWCYNADLSHSCCDGYCIPSSEYWHGCCALEKTIFSGGHTYCCGTIAINNQTECCPAGCFSNGQCCSTCTSKPNVGYTC